MSDKPQKPALRSATWPFVMSLVMVGAFVALFYILKSSAGSQFDATIAALPSVKLFGSGSTDTVRGYYASYGALAGLVFALSYLIVGYILLGILAIVRLTKRPFGVSLACLLATLPFVLFGYALANQPGIFTPIAAGAVYFVGRPLMYASTAMLAAGLILFFLSFKYGKDKKTV